MQIKSYIAIFFIAVFLGKFITIDSKFLGVFVDSEEITLVNPFCKKLQPNTPKEIQSFDEASLFHNITVHVICASPFQFEIYNDSIAFAAPNYQKHSYQTQSIISNYRDKFYPPPKV
ncbi:MAG TPA: hypothetical protein VLM44_12705 [Lutibacter sp.]|nr:hypothetical protein [Lutibacter sp.]